MTGWLVVNGFTHTEKFNTLFEMLLEAAKRNGISLIKKYNTDLWVMLGNCNNDPLVAFADKPDFIIFWDKDIRLCKVLEDMGIPVFNSSEAIRLCDDKAETYLALRGTGIKQPKTFISAKQFRSCTDYSSYIACANAIGYPVIVKECKGSFGGQVYIVFNEEDLKLVISKIEDRGFIIQEFIKDTDDKITSDSTISARDIRLQMVGSKCVAAMLRTNDNDFRANITNGGSMHPYTPTDEQISMAVKVMEALKLDFAGIDILFGKNDEPIFCEANSNAHFKNLYDCTGINTADFIMEYIKEKVCV